MNDVLVSWVKYISGKTSQGFLPLLGILSMLTAELTSKDKGVSFLLPTLDAIIRAQKVNPLTLMLPATRLSSATFSISTSSQNNALLRDCGGLSALDMITIGGQLHVVFAALELLSVLTVGDAMFNLDSFPYWALPNATRTTSKM
ncbi:Na(+)/citrate cotransporter [Rhipicephalus microplus]|uniref:Na(+)/citrate cotransporter n=1 Tax=Rhipicephalus microplus TaxID=6941 RepID=UPI002376ADEE